MKQHQKRVTDVSVRLSIKNEWHQALPVSMKNGNMKKKGLYLEIGNQNEVYYLQPENILYVEADGNYCDIHLTDGDVLETLSFQRAEVARRIEDQLPSAVATNFMLIGRQYLVNTDRIMYVNANKQQLAFDVNMPGTCKKKCIKASTVALRNLRTVMDDQQLRLEMPINYEWEEEVEEDYTNIQVVEIGSGTVLPPCGVDDEWDYKPSKECEVKKDEGDVDDEWGDYKPRKDRSGKKHKQGGFASHIAGCRAEGNRFEFRKKVRSYDIEEDEVMMLGMKK